MVALVDQAKEAGDTLGGAVTVIAHGVPAGLGSHVQWDEKLDGRLAQALMSIPAVKAVEIGDALAQSARPRQRRPRRHRAHRDGRLAAGPPTAPAASRAASPTARTWCSPPTRSRSRPCARPAAASTSTPSSPRPSQYERSDVTALPACRRHRRGDGGAGARRRAAREAGRRLAGRAARPLRRHPGAAAALAHLRGLSPLPVG